MTISELCTGDGSAYEFDQCQDKPIGSDGKRVYTLLESQDLCGSCLKNIEMKKLGIEQVSFQVYHLAEEKLFNMDFNVMVDSGKIEHLHFFDRIASEKEYVKFFSDVERVASNVGATGLAKLANRAVVLVSNKNEFPPDKNSAYFRCMANCDKMEVPFQLLCYIFCEFCVNDKPGS